MKHPWLDPYNRDLTPGMQMHLQALFKADPTEEARLRKVAKRIEALLERDREQFAFGDIFETKSSHGGIGLSDWLVTRKILKRQVYRRQAEAPPSAYVFMKTPYTWGFVRYMDPEVPK